jgi:hypothetical protein
MTPEAQRIAIATACPTLVAKHEHGPGYVWNRGPLRPFDPLSDLNACHEMEKVLAPTKDEWEFNNGRYIRYGENLCRVCDWSEHERTMFAWHVYHATAAQRCEAFLRTLSLWTD